MTAKHLENIPTAGPPQANLAASGVVGDLDLMHMMSYDQHGKHSTWSFGKQAVDQGAAAREIAVNQ